MQVFFSEIYLKVKSARLLYNVSVNTYTKPSGETLILGCKSQSGIFLLKQIQYLQGNLTITDLPLGSISNGITKNSFDGKLVFFEYFLKVFF